MQNKRLSVRQYYFGEFKELNISDNAPFKFIIEGTDCYCYNIDFAHLLTTDKIIKNNLKPIDFIQDFKNGFVEGLLHLETKESIKRSDFYDQNKRPLLQGQLEFILYRKEYPDGYTGLVEFTQIVPLLFTSKVIHKTGYYNGLIHSVLTLANDLNLEAIYFRARNNPEDLDWFKVGIKFADGTITYQTLNRPTFKEITIAAGLRETLRPYVSSTYQSSGEKNIFKNKHKMQTIYNYCIDNRINLSDWFLMEYQKFNNIN